MTNRGTDILGKPEVLANFPIQKESGNYAMTSDSLITFHILREILLMKRSFGTKYSAVKMEIFPRQSFGMSEDQGRPHTT